MTERNKMTTNRTILEKYFKKIRDSYDEHLINSDIFDVMLVDFMEQLQKGYSTRLIFYYNGEIINITDLDEQNSLITHLINYYQSINNVSNCKTLQFVRNSINKVN